MSARTGDPLEPLSFAPSFRVEGYEIRPGVERRWRGMTERVYTDRDGWFDHPDIARTATVLSIGFFDGPLVEVTDIDLAAHDEHDGYGCLTAGSGLPPITDEPGKQARCVCGRWWVLREVAGFVVWQRPGRLPPP